MAYPFFTKSSSKPAPFFASSPPSSTSSQRLPGRLRSNSKTEGQSKLQFNKVIPSSPPATITPPSSTAAGSHNGLTFEPEPFPRALERTRTPHPNVTIDPIKSSHLAPLTRITGVLLPIRYPSSFYTATINDPIVASVSRVAVYHDHPATSTLGISPFSSSFANSDKVIGAIRCRLEPLPATMTSPESRSGTNLYIQALHLLAPYRGNGIAAALLNSLLYDASKSVDMTKVSLRKISPLVKHYNIRTVSAHVHEMNDEALEWYVSRGFSVQPGTVEGYYRRLQPGGAKVVVLHLDWNETRRSRVQPAFSSLSTPKKPVKNEIDPHGTAEQKEPAQVDDMTPVDETVQPEDNTRINDPTEAENPTPVDNFPGPDNSAEYENTAEDENIPQADKHPESIAETQSYEHDEEAVHKAELDEDWEKIEPEEASPDKLGDHTAFYSKSLTRKKLRSH